MREQRLKIGTRGSPLALAQAHETRARLMAALGRKVDDFEIIAIKTMGDVVRDRPLSEFGGKGVFTKELEDALFSGAIDLAVHSLKDMPSVLPDGLEIASVLPREDVRDAFISVKSSSIMDLPRGAKLGSSSVRRTAQALRLRPDLVPSPFRGNVETRLQKLKDGVADATFLAVAGLKRLGLGSMITALVDTDEMLPCVAQGAIGIEINSARAEMREIVAKINHETSQFAVDCERAFMAALDGSCRTPIAGHAVIKNGEVHFRGEALTVDGKHHFPVEAKGAVADRVKIGREAGQEVKIHGGSLIAY